MVASAYNSPHHNGSRLGGPPQVSRPSFSNHPSDFPDNTSGYFSRSLDFCCVSFPFLALFLVLWVNVEIFFLPNLFFFSFLPSPNYISIFFLKSAFIPKHEGYSKKKQNYKNCTKYKQRLSCQEPEEEEIWASSADATLAPDHLNIQILYVI